MNYENIDLSDSDAYANYIISEGSRPVCNGNMLLQLQESLYLYDQFIASLNT